MARARYLPFRLAALCAVLLALAGSIDLHFAFETGSASHGVFEGSHGAASGEDIFVSVEPCSDRDARHMEAAERRVFGSCPLCLRNLENRAVETTLARGIVAARASETLFSDQERALVARSYSPKSVRGPPIT